MQNLKNKFQTNFKKYWQLYLFLMIPAAYIVIFHYVPMYGAQIAFKKYDLRSGIWGSPWIGFDNFLRFIDSYYFDRVMTNTILLSLYQIVAGLPFPILLALGLNYLKSVRYKKTIQLTTYIPHFISVVVIVGIIVQLLNTRSGLINLAVQALGSKPIDFLGNPKYFRHIFVWSGIWQNMGWGSIIYMSALSGISMELHEAAVMDGATKLKRMWHVDLPGIKPTIIILLLLNLGGILNVGFEKVYLLQNPLNMRTSEVISTFIFNVGIVGGAANYSYVTAVGLFQSIFGFILLTIVNKVAKKISEISLW